LRRRKLKSKHDTREDLELKNSPDYASIIPEKPHANTYDTAITKSQSHTSLENNTQHSNPYDTPIQTKSQPQQFSSKTNESSRKSSSNVISSDYTNLGSATIIEKNWKRKFWRSVFWFLGK